MTTTNGLTDGIIKQDSRGRLRTTPERREALLVEFDRSGMSGQKFSAWAGIKYSTWANWVQQRRKAQGRVASAPNETKPGGDGANHVRWLEAVVGASTEKASAKPKTGVLIVQGAGGMRIEIADEAQVKLAAQLLRELGWKPGC
jgi:transposase